MDDNKLRFYEITAGGKQYWFWIPMGIFDLSLKIQEHEWIGDLETMVRCSSIESIQLTDEEYEGSLKDLDKTIMFM